VRPILGMGSWYLLVLTVIGGYYLLIVFLERWEPWLAMQIAIYLSCCRYSAFSQVPWMSAATNSGSSMGVAEAHRSIAAQAGSAPRRGRGYEGLWAHSRRLARSGLGNVPGLVDQARSRARRLPLAVRARRPLGRPTLCDSINARACRSLTYVEARRRGARHRGAAAQN